MLSRTAWYTVLLMMLLASVAYSFTCASDNRSLPFIIPPFLLSNTIFKKLSSVIALYRWRSRKQSSLFLRLRIFFLFLRSDPFHRHKRGSNGRHTTVI